MDIQVSVPDGVRNNWRVDTFEVTERDEALSRIRAISDPLGVVRAGKYKRLMRGQTVVMSNTQMEVRTHSHFIYRAKGNVLINGLGLGMALTAVLKKPEVERVTVIEREADVIALVAPHFTDARLTIIHGDAFTHQPPKGERFAAVWHDIWDEITSDNLPDMTRLCRKYGRRADWQGCWAREYCERYR